MNVIFKDEQNKDVSGIYCITNKLNGKKYIGQTTNYRKRSSNYRTAHLHDYSNEYTNFIYKVIKEEGSDNFEMELIYECDPSELYKYETYFIDKYDTTNPEKGYNFYLNIKMNSNSEQSRINKSIAHTGLKESAETKRKKSNRIYAIKDETLIICDSGKLFGDYVGKSKDYIKNCLRQPSSISGFNLFYADREKRQEIRHKMETKRSIRNKRYMQCSLLLDLIDVEGVETMKEYFDLYILEYSDLLTNCSLELYQI